MNTLLTLAIIIIILWAVGFFALPGGGLINTYTACDCRNLSGYLAVDRQKAVEINHASFFVKF
jgi:hypothetical protein